MDRSPKLFASRAAQRPLVLYAALALTLLGVSLAPVKAAADWGSLKCTASNFWCDYNAPVGTTQMVVGIMYHPRGVYLPAICASTATTSQITALNTWQTTSLAYIHSLNLYLSAPSPSYIRTQITVVNDYADASSRDFGLCSSSKLGWLWLPITQGPFSLDLYGNEGVDSLSGPMYGNYYAYLHGAGGDDVLVGFNNLTRAYGGPGSDRLSSRTSEVVTSSERLYGEAGNDCLYDLNQQSGGLDCGTGTDKVNASITAAGVTGCETEVSDCLVLQ